MRSRLATRSARLVLTALVAAALTAAATTTALAGSGSTTDAAQKDGWGQVCGTTDLTFKVSEETQAGGYFLVAAKAKPGITCYLEGTIPSASFGSAPDTQASPAEQAVSDTIKLSGSATAYAGINPKSTNTNYGKELGQLIIAVVGDESNAVAFKLPRTVLVDEPITTNWHANPADAVPFTD
ncbi:DUF4232 domain-containing protein [Streptomyces sp. NBC_01433]|uniref:DUF4232 domain-containing protein n=1 Tax=Streptomyces sp. NBC_01433 TaxID=2903864 RepID=UPI0022548132|nr:DUF4232 domain-containing protein [Streptomyces sp. NBC_01433]MCX4679269.1 DUF4232 domain-containing protein [Streptomyces sp. NBC_01433]